MKSINNVPIKTESGEKPNAVTSFFAYLVAYTIMLGIFLACLAFSATMFTLLLKGILQK